MTTTNTFPAAILFDHDGTLVDTEPVWAAAKVALAADFGGTWTEQDSSIAWACPCSSLWIVCASAA